MNQQLSAAVRKQLVKDLKKLEKQLKAIKSLKVIDLELYKAVKERIEFIRNKLNFKK